MASDKKTEDEKPSQSYKIYRPDATYIDLMEFINITNTTGETIRVTNDTIVLGALLGGLLLTQIEIANATWALVAEKQAQRQRDYEWS